MTPKINQELQDYYENRFSMMATKGWVDFIEDTQGMFDSYNKVTSISDNLEFRKGQLDILQWILSLKAVSEQAYGELQE